MIYSSSSLQKPNSKNAKIGAGGFGFSMLGLDSGVPQFPEVPCQFTENSRTFDEVSSSKRPKNKLIVRQNAPSHSPSPLSLA